MNHRILRSTVPLWLKLKPSLPSFASRTDVNKSSIMDSTSQCVKLISRISIRALNTHRERGCSQLDYSSNKIWGLSLWTVSSIISWLNGISFFWLHVMLAKYIWSIMVTNFLSDYVTKSSHHYSWMILLKCHQVDDFNKLCDFWVIHVKRFRKMSTHESALCLEIIDLRHMSLSHENVWKDCGSFGEMLFAECESACPEQNCLEDVLSYLRRLKWPLNFHINQKIKGVGSDLH